MHKVLGPVLQKVYFALQVRNLQDGFNVMQEIAFALQTNPYFSLPFASNTTTKGLKYEVVWNLLETSIYFALEKKEEIWLSSVTKAPSLTDKSKKQRDNKNATKTSITQRLRADLGRSVGVTTTTTLVWLNRLTSAQPFH